MRTSSNRPVVVLSAGMLALVTAACSTGDVARESAALRSDAAADAVAPERWVADAAEACPAAYAANAPHAGLNTGFVVSGQSRAFHLILPNANLYPGPRPLFVAFNGTGESGPSFSSRARLTDFAARGFVVVAPSSAGNGSLWPVWDALHQPGDADAANKDLATFDALTACLAAHFELDAKRVYIGGHSAGGIMTNYVLQRRSDVVAGGIVGSGVFSLTSPPGGGTPPAAFALVTWGGINDQYSGTAGNVSVPQINFVEQAGLASTYYDGLPGWGQVACHGDDWGHAWLDEVNDTLVDYLLAHPKGLAPTTEADDVGAPAGSGVTCSTAPFDGKVGADLVCPSSDAPSCTATCQLFADCGVENGTVGSVLLQQLGALGFTRTSCGGCVDACEDRGSADADVLACFAQHQAGAACGPGIEGAAPLFGAVNACCQGRGDAPFCVELCGSLLANEAAAPFFPGCADLDGPPPGGEDGCAHDVCAQGAKLDAACSSCATAVCDADPYCCETAWDHLCTGAVPTRCGTACN